MSNEDFSSSTALRIPKRRLEELRSCMEKIEKLGKVKIEIGQEITITGDPVDTFVASNVITAIGRGFDFRDASLLFDDNFLYVINISKDKRDLTRIRARLIGTAGKARMKIEEMTKTRICIYGKTVSIIGKDENLENARVAIEKIIEGRSHIMVFKFLEAKNKD